eukprot:NODE_3373_length_563_cov_581.003891_g2846_i0.p1 GENE.NODE_3373_length_563_cov_581.003891_g2846_i0~~NODE_3373_length_563_cov_581.003891_g2846_i0.p1  ORF type:complete len:97 (+),score=21.16 NODE_3373_length_563_cov_581.003891_g2846_i0:77-367(+)
MPCVGAYKMTAAKNVNWGTATNTLPYKTGHLYVHPEDAAWTCDKTPGCIGFVHHFGNGDAYLFKHNTLAKTKFHNDAVWNAFVKSSAIENGETEGL